MIALFRAGLTGAGAAALPAFVFALPFLVHPLVSFMVGTG